MSGKPKIVSAKLKRVLVNPAAPVLAAHRFLYTRVGTEVQMDVGYFDLPDVRAIVEAAKAAADTDAEVPFFVTHRFTLSLEAATQLAEMANQLVKDLKGIGVVTEDRGDDDNAS